jgi:hypothetical protein
MENNEIINGVCWVAYFDRLGFRHIVEHFLPEGVLEDYEEVLKEIKQKLPNVKHKFFSDSFVFYTKDDSQDSFCNIEGTLRLFFHKMFDVEIPMRGCLNIGQFYANEEKSIFFGRALTEAYDLAENQNWIGFVLSEKAVQKGGPCLNTIRQYYYLEYDVPYKEQIKRLLVYNLNIGSSIDATEATPQQCRLWNHLISMEGTASVHLHETVKRKKIVGWAKCRVCRNTIIKYKNTKKFLLHVYPALKKRIKNKNRQISYTS